jgi:hypothetical protein
MAKYLITLIVDGARKESVEKTLKIAFKGQEPVLYAVEKKTSPESRSERLNDAASIMEDAKTIVKELKDEMQEWYDSIPENLQNGNKAEEVQSAIDALDDVQNEMESISFDSVEFPGMF